MTDDPTRDDPNPSPAPVDQTDRPETSELGGGTLPPEELTGRASSTAEDLEALFKSASAEHIADGFLGGSDDDEDVAIPKESDTPLEGDQ